MLSLGCVDLVMIIHAWASCVTGSFQSIMSRFALSSLLFSFFCAVFSATSEPFMRADLSFCFFFVLLQICGRFLLKFCNEATTKFADQMYRTGLFPYLVVLVASRKLADLAAVLSFLQASPCSLNRLMLSTPTFVLPNCTKLIFAFKSIQNGRTD